MAEKLGSRPEEQISEQEQASRLLDIIEPFKVPDQEIQLTELGNQLEKAGFEEGDFWFTLGEKDNQLIAFAKPFVTKRNHEWVYFLITSNGLRGIIINPIVCPTGPASVEAASGSVHSLDMRDRFVDSLKMLQEDKVEPADFEYRTGVSSSYGRYESLRIPVGDSSLNVSRIFSYIIENARKEGIKSAASAGRRKSREHEVERPFKFFSESSYEFSRIQEVFEQALRRRIKNPYAYVLFTPEMEEEAMQYIKDFLRDGDASLSDIISEFIGSPKKTNKLWRILISEAKIGHPEPTRKNVRICPFLWLHPQEEMIRDLYYISRGIDSTVAESALGFQNAGFSFRSIVGKGINLSYSDFMYQEREKRIPQVRALLERIGAEQQTIDRLLRDKNMGLKLMTTAVIADAYNNLGKDQTKIKTGSRLAFSGIRNPELVAWGENARDWPFTSGLLAQEERARLIYKGEIVGQNLRISPGEVMVYGGFHDAGKTNLLRAITANLSASSADLPVLAERAEKPQFSSIHVIAPEVRAEDIGSRLELELRQFAKEFKLAESAGDLPLFLWDDFGQATNLETALALFPTMVELIKARFPKAMVLVSSHVADELSEAYQGEEEFGQLIFKQLNREHRLVDFDPGGSYKHIDSLVSGAVGAGAKRAVRKRNFISELGGDQRRIRMLPEEVHERGRIWGTFATDAATLDSIFRVSDWIEDEVIETALDDDSKRRIASEFYRLLKRSKPEHYSSWVKLGKILTPELCRLVFEGDGKIYTIMEGREIIYQLGLVIRREHRGPEQWLSDTVFGSVGANVTHAAGGIEKKGEDRFRNKEFEEKMKLKAIADLAFARLCYLAGEDYFSGPKFEGAVNLGLLIAKQNEEIEPISFPEEIFDHQTRVKMFIGINWGGKTEAAKTAAAQAIFYSEDLGYAGAYFIERHKRLTEKPSGEFSRLMQEVGTVIRSIEIKNEQKIKSDGELKPILVVLDEPFRGTSFKLRARLLNKLIKMFPENVEFIVVTNSAPEEMVDELKEDGIESPIYHVPSYLGEEEDKKPFCLYPGRAKIDNTLLIGNYLGPDALERFVHWRERLKE